MDLLANPPVQENDLAPCSFCFVDAHSLPSGLGFGNTRLLADPFPDDDYCAVDEHFPELFFISDNKIDTPNVTLTLILYACR